MTRCAPFSRRPGRRAGTPTCASPSNDASASPADRTSGSELQGLADQAHQRPERDPDDGRRHSHRLEPALAARCPRSSPSGPVAGPRPDMSRCARRARRPATDRVLSSRNELRPRSGGSGPGPLVLPGSVRATYRCALSVGLETRVVTGCADCLRVRRGRLTFTGTGNRGSGRLWPGAHTLTAFAIEPGGGWHRSRVRRSRRLDGDFATATDRT